MANNKKPVLYTESGGEGETTYLLLHGLGATGDVWHGIKSIIKEKRAICITPKTIYIKDGIKTERTNGISVSDFTNLTRHVEFYHTKTGNKKNVRDLKCKKK